MDIKFSTFARKKLVRFSTRSSDNQAEVSDFSAFKFDFA
jgi:hypothetical protein